MLVDTLYIVHVYGQCMTIQSFTFIDMLQYCFFSCTYKICHTIYSVEQHGTSYYNYPQTLCVAQPLTLRMSCCRIYDRRNCRKYMKILRIRSVFQFRIQSFQSLGFRVQGFRVWAFRVWSFRVLNGLVFQGLGEISKHWPCAGV